MLVIRSINILRRFDFYNSLCNICNICLIHSIRQANFPDSLVPTIYSQNAIFYSNNFNSFEFLNGSTLDTMNMFFNNTVENKQHCGVVSRNGFSKASCLQPNQYICKKGPSACKPQGIFSGACFYV